MTRLFPLQSVRALICQLLAFAIAIGLAPKLARFGIDQGWLIGLQAFFATLFSRLVRQPIWWVPIHLLFLPAAWFLSSYHLPSWLYLAVLLILLLIYWGTFKGEVPLFLSSAKVVEALSLIGDAEAAGSLIDLGAGLGSVVVPLAKLRPQLKITAVENAPLPWLVLAWRCRRLPNVRVVRKNLWHYSLADYAVVFAFLSPAVMPRLGRKCRLEMPSGSLLVSSSFAVSDWPPERVIEFGDGRGTRLYCYRMTDD